jgi:3-oxoadipate enol-lactonase
MPLVSAGQVELSFERSGSGPPLLLIMGMSGTAAHWGKPFLELLRKDFEVIVYDHRGVGASSRVDGPFVIADLADDAANLLEALEIRSADMFGISMGGMIAQELALAHPEMIRTLTLGCTYCGGGGGVLTTEPVMQRLTEGMLSGDRERALRTAWEANVSEHAASNQDLYESFRLIGVEHAVALEVIMAQMQAITKHDTSERLASLDMPTLIVHGTEDQMLPVANAHVIHGHMPDAKLQILDGVGHLFFWEQPERSAELLTEHAGNV